MQPARVLDDGAVRNEVISTRWPAFGLIFLGVTIVYLVGFLNLPQAHNATHDTRHATGFPCH
jgi:cobalt transporter subunit CbtB